MRKLITTAALALSLLGVAGAADASTYYGHGPHGGRVVVHTNDRFHGPHRVWVRGERFVPGRAGFVLVSDWRGYGLHRPIFGAHWVRVGPDFLLISNRTGRVLEVVPRY